MRHEAIELVCAPVCQDQAPPPHHSDVLGMSAYKKVLYIMEESGVSSHPDAGTPFRCHILIDVQLSSSCLAVVRQLSAKRRLSYHLCIECFSQLSFDLEAYTKSATAADFVYASESNESCEKHSTQR